MSSLSKQIEGYLKEMIDQVEDGVVEVQRNYLSEYFHCVPSQINYVLSTRFTPAHGYLVETHRGGGGYIRIVSLQLDRDDDLRTVVIEGIGDQISQRDGEGLVTYLVAQGLLTDREGQLIGAMLTDRVLSGAEHKDELRANMLQHLFAALSLGT